jgi:hypothetical protein
MYDITYKIKELDIFNDLDFPRLISYPRTGSHWFRIIMELYLGEPCVVQSFFKKRPEKVWGFHIHNRLIHKPHPSEGPTKNLARVIYLYRDPIDTLFSQMKYHGNIPKNWKGDYQPNMIEPLKKYMKEYRDHLENYLFCNDKNFCYVKYEDIKTNPEDVFRRVTQLIDRPWKPKIFKDIYKLCDKKLTNHVTPHDEAALDKDILTNKMKVTQQKISFKNYYSREIREYFKEYYDRSFGK